VTIEKGREWGWNAALAGDAPVVATNAELRTHIEQHRRRGTEIAPAGIVGGDLWTTVGSPTGGLERLRGNDARTGPIDVASVLLDGRQFWFGSHLVARRSWWKGPILIVLNAEWIGDWDLGPRSHPNDGHVDVYETNMAFSQRLKARKRLSNGTHLPHPDIRSRRVKALQHEFDQPLDVWLDDVNVGRFTNLTLRVEPDAMTLTW
jgi:hypothetical protein